MGAFLGELIGNIPAEAYGVYLAMFVLTFGLIRCSMHPTLFAFIALPGTACHELSHYAVGLLLGGKPSSISLMPKSLGDGRWQLGSVTFTNLKWWSAPWTAMAPMLLAPLALLLGLVWVYPTWQSGDVVWALASLYVCSTILQASWPSRVDFEIAFPGLALMGLLVAWLW